MKIFTALQVRQWDAFTIAHEPVRSIDLMERASTACFTWLTSHFKNTGSYTLFCGTGNNGGDGLAIARMLLQAGNTVMVYIAEGDKRSENFSANLDRIETTIPVLQFIDGTDFPELSNDTIIIDALFGSGLTRPLNSLVADLVTHINQSGKIIISIDIPTGLFADAATEGNIIIRASHTLSFQAMKLAFLMGDNNKYTGHIELLDIGLHPDFYQDETSRFHTVEKKDIIAIYKPGNQFAHKYNFGHALLYAGSKDMMGAAILCAKACLRSGAGLVTVYTEENTQPIIQTALPEAITSTENDIEKLSQKKSAIGIGPGWALSKENEDRLEQIISTYPGPIVIDASALQMLANNMGLLMQRQLNPAILTPHTGEFEKLFGKAANDFDRMDMAIQQSIKLGCYIILKGHHTLVACPDGEAFFNTTGNAGMATAGSGDTLTGMLTGLLAQGYLQKNACVMGVYLHGMAGDIAAEKMSQESMIAGDIIDCLGAAHKSIAPSTNR